MRDGSSMKVTGIGGGDPARKHDFNAGFGRGLNQSVEAYGNEVRESDGLLPSANGGLIPFLPSGLRNGSGW